MRVGSDCSAALLRAAGVLLLVAASAGCGSDGGGRGGGWYTLLLVPEAGTDPFADPSAEFLYLRIETRTFESLAEEEFALEDDDLALDGAPTGSELYFVVEVRDGEIPRGVIADGRSGPHALESGEHTTVTVVLEEAS